MPETEGPRERKLLRLLAWLFRQRLQLAMSCDEIEVGIDRFLRGTARRVARFRKQKPRVLAAKRRQPRYRAQLDDYRRATERVPDLPSPFLLRMLASMPTRVGLSRIRRRKGDLLVAIHQTRRGLDIGQELRKASAVLRAIGAVPPGRLRWNLAEVLLWCYDKIGDASPFGIFQAALGALRAVAGRLRAVFSRREFPEAAQVTYWQRRLLQQTGRLMRHALAKGKALEEAQCRFLRDISRWIEKLVLLLTERKPELLDRQYAPRVQAVFDDLFAALDSRHWVPGSGRVRAAHEAVCKYVQEARGYVETVERARRATEATEQAMPYVHRADLREDLRQVARDMEAEATDRPSPPAPETFGPSRDAA